MVARLCHLGLNVSDAGISTQFFEKAFGVKRLGDGDDGVYLSDRTINLAGLRAENKEKNEPSHFARWVKGSAHDFHIMIDALYRPPLGFG